MLRVLLKCCQHCSTHAQSLPEYRVKVDADGDDEESNYATIETRQISDRKKKKLIHSREDFDGRGRSNRARSDNTGDDQDRHANIYQVWIILLELLNLLSSSMNKNKPSYVSHQIFANI